MNKKAQAFIDFTKERELKVWADIYEAPAEDKVHTVIFEAVIEAGEDKLPLRLYMDDSFYIMLTVRAAAGAVTAANKEAVLEGLNYYNSRYKIFKYYADSDGDIFLESCLPAGDEHLDCDLIYTVLLRVIVPHVLEEYKNIKALLKK